MYKVCTKIIYRLNYLYKVYTKKERKGSAPAALPAYRINQFWQRVHAKKNYKNTKNPGIQKWWTNTKI